MNEKLITILTPSYNRGHLLHKLFESLKKQNSYNFIWLIVDDGSSDSTREIVDIMKKDSPFDVEYIYKNNGGKHTAINVGVGRINTELTFIVDSDDMLLDNAIVEIEKVHRKHCTNNKICGYSFQRVDFSGNINVESGYANEHIGSYIDVRLKRKKIGDMAEVYKTNILKDYPFPIFGNEKFLGEDIIWIEIAKTYDLVFLNIPIYVCDYLNEGLTKNRRKITMSNPIGCYEIAKKMLELDFKFSIRVKASIQSIVYGLTIKKSKREIFNLAPTINRFMFLPAYLLHKQWEKKYIRKG